MFRQRAKTLRGVGSKEKGQLYLDGWTLDYNLFRDHESMNGNPPGQAAKVNPPFNEWADVVKGRTHPESVGPAVRAGATSMRVEIPAGVDVASEVYNGNVPTRKPIPDGVDVAPEAYRDPVPKRKPIPDGVDVAPEVYRDPVPTRKPIPDGADVAPEVYRDPMPKRKPIPDGAEVAGKVDSDHRLKRPKGRRKTPAALKPKSGYKPRGSGAQGNKPRVKVRQKIRTNARQAKKG